MSEDYRLLTLEEAARRLGVRWTHVRELVETGQLRAVTIGSRYRVPASALQELGRSVGGPPVGPPVPGSVGAPAGRNGAGPRPLRESNRAGWDGRG